MTGLCYSTNNYLYTGGRDGKSIGVYVYVLYVVDILGSLSIWNTNNNDCVFNWNSGCREIS